MDAVKLMCGCAALLALSTQLVRLPDADRRAIVAGVQHLWAPPPTPSGKAPSGRAPSAPASFVPQPYVASLTQTQTIAPDRFGQYHTVMEVEGQRLPVLVDTGASYVLLSFDDADRLGLRPSPAEFRYKVSTANGTAYVAEIELREVTVGSIVVRHVPALIASRGALAQSLLGMSFLSRLGGFRVDGGSLVLLQ